MSVQIIERNGKIQTLHLPATEVPVLAQAEVVVVGGGTAGFIAATAAARAGARTILVERLGYLSGSLSATYATTPGLFGDSEGRQIIGGLGWEFVERMEQAGYALVNRQHWSVHLLPEVSKQIALEMVSGAGVELYLHTWLSEAVMEGTHIRGLAAQTKGGRVAILGQVFVDASGDADLAAAAGAPCELLPPDELWQTSLDLTIANIDTRRVLEWAQANAGQGVWLGSRVEVDETQLGPVISIYAASRETSDEPGAYVGPAPTIKLMPYPTLGRVQGSVEVDPLDVRGLTQAEVEARRRAMQHLAYLRALAPGFERAVVVSESHLGVRESRRIVGEYVLSLRDLLENARFPDVVALNCRALDRHTKGEVFQIEFLSGNHDIPLRALRPQGVENLFVAGRCISCDHASHASLRGAATCLATGHAAGVAAALASRGSWEVGAVQEVLREQGAILEAR